MTLSAHLPERIVFLDGRQPMIPRSSSMEDADKTLRSLGYSISNEMIDPDRMMATLAGLKEQRDSTLAWPNTYNIDASPNSPSIFELLASAQIPYVGPSSRLSEFSSKRALQDHLRSVGLPSPRSFLVEQSIESRDSSRLEVAIQEVDLTFPVVVKAEYSTGSRGVFVAGDFDALRHAVGQVVDVYQQTAIIQEWCRVREYTCAVIARDEDALVASIELDHADDLTIFDIKAKECYEGIALQSPEVEMAKRLRDLIQGFWSSSGGGTHARIDVIEDEDGRLHIIDVNLLPCIDNNAFVKSLFPMAFEWHYDLDYEGVLLALINQAFR